MATQACKSPSGHVAAMATEAGGQKATETPLRQFVYLDEVSVYSLIASRFGPIAAEFTEKQTASLQTEIKPSLGAGSGVAKAGVDSRLTTGQTQESQVKIDRADHLQRVLQTGTRLSCLAAGFRRSGATRGE